MKSVKILLATTAIVAMSVSTAFAGANCGAKASSCGSKQASVQTASAASCGSAATAQQASVGAACATKASAGCSPAQMASCTSSCPPEAMAACLEKGDCAGMAVVYRVSADGVSTNYTDREQAMAAATDGATMQFLAAGTTYETEHEAMNAMIGTIKQRMADMMTVQYQVGSETMHCGTSAAKMAESKDAKVMYRVGAKSFDSPDAAKAYLVKVESAVKAVKITDAEGQAVQCTSSYAKSHCSTKTAFKCGDKETKDPVQANLLMVQEQFRTLLNTEA